jgi:hypothetical protein
MAPVSRPKPSRPRTPADEGVAGKSAAQAQSTAGPVDSVPASAPASAATERPVYAPGAAPFEKVSRWLLLLVAAAAGVAVGGLGSFGHRATATWLSVSWPTGLVLCFGGLIGLMLALGELSPGAPESWLPTRLSAISCASAGWLIALIWLTYLGPPFTFARKGDVILPNDWKSITYLLGGMALIVVAAYRAWLASLNARLAQRPGGSGSVHPRG